MKNLNYYRSLAAKGDANAAFEAAKIMYHEKYSDVFVQAMLRDAARLGNVNAQRWLGFVGLNNKLLHPSSTVSNIIYCSDASVSYRWLEKAAKSGDVLSAFAVCKCLQHGIGVDKNEAKAQAILDSITNELSFDILPFMFIFETYRSSQNVSHNADLAPKLKKLLAG